MSGEFTPTKIREMLSKMLNNSNSKNQIDAIKTFEFLYCLDFYKFETTFFLISKSEWRMLFLESEHSVKLEILDFAKLVFRNKETFITQFYNDLLKYFFYLFDEATQLSNNVDQILKNNNQELVKKCLEVIDLLVANFYCNDAFDPLIAVLPNINNVFIRDKISEIFVTCLDNFNWHLEDYDFHSTFSLFRKLLSDPDNTFLENNLITMIIKFFAVTFKCKSKYFINEKGNVDTELEYFIISLAKVKNIDLSKFN